MNTRIFRRTVLGLLSDLFKRQPAITGINTFARDEAFDLLERHGLRAHYYLPAIGIDDKELADACRFLASAGYLISQSDGTLVGKVAAARQTTDERAAVLRATFAVVKSGQEVGES